MDPSQRSPRLADPRMRGRITRREVLGAGAVGLATGFLPPSGRTGVIVSTSRARRAASLDDDIRALMRRGRIPGLAACIVKAGEIAWARGFGRLNVGRDVPTTAGTVFMLASISKTFIATAVMQAVEDALVELDDDVNELLPFDVRNPEHPDVAITLRMLLTHTSSIRDRYSVWGRPGQPGSLYSHGDSPVPLGAFLRRYLVEDGRLYVEEKNFYPFAPGTAYRYSNIAAALAAYVVESLSGIGFDEWCDQRIFGPLGMRETGWHLRGLDRGNVAMPYRWDRSSERYVAYGQYGYPDYPDGALRTSAPQLARHLLAFVGMGEWNGMRILQASSVGEIRRSQIPDVIAGQGLLWYQRSFDGERMWGHNGGDFGVATQMACSPRVTREVRAGLPPWPRRARPRPRTRRTEGRRRSPRDSA